MNKDEDFINFEENILRILEYQNLFKSKLLCYIKSLEKLSTLGLHSIFDTSWKKDHNLSSTTPNVIIQVDMES